MRRIHIYTYRRNRNKISILDEPAHYLKNVLRMKAGSKFYAFDGTGKEYELEIKRVSDTDIETEIIAEKIKEEKEPPIKINRWKKIVAEGSKIAGRTKIPDILIPDKFENIVSQQKNSILFWERSDNNLKIMIDRLFKRLDKTNTLRIFIGPEGGFTEKEVKLATQNDVLIASLGSRILSVETATISALSVIMYELENVKS